MGVYFLSNIHVIKVAHQVTYFLKRLCYVRLTNAMETRKGDCNLVSKYSVFEDFYVKSFTTCKLDFSDGNSNY